MPIRRILGRKYVGGSSRCCCCNAAMQFKWKQKGCPHGARIYLKHSTQVGSAGHEKRREECDFALFLFFCGVETIKAMTATIYRHVWLCMCETYTCGMPTLKAAQLDCPKLYQSIVFRYIDCAHWAAKKVPVRNIRSILIFIPDFISRF